MICGRGMALRGYKYAEAGDYSTDLSETRAFLAPNALAVQASYDEDDIFGKSDESDVDAETQAKLLLEKRISLALYVKAKQLSENATRKLVEHEAK